MILSIVQQNQCEWIQQQFYEQFVHIDLEWRDKFPSNDIGMRSEMWKKKREDDEQNWAKQSVEQAKLREAVETSALDVEQVEEIKKYRILEEDAQKAMYYFVSGLQGQTALPKVLFIPWYVSALYGTIRPAVTAFHATEEIEGLARGFQVTWRYKYKYADSAEQERVVYLGPSQLKTVVEKWQQAGSPAPLELKRAHAWHEAEKERRKKDQEDSDKKREEDEQNWAKQSVQQAKLKEAAETSARDVAQVEEIKKYRILAEYAQEATAYFVNKIWDIESGVGPVFILDQTGVPEVLFLPRHVTLCGSMQSGVAILHDTEEIEDLACGCQITWKYKWKKGDTADQERVVYLGPSQLKTVVEKWRQAGSPPAPRGTGREQYFLERKRANEAEKERRKKDQKENDKKREEDEQNWAKHSQRQDELRREAERGTLSSEQVKEIMEYRIPADEASQAFDYYSNKIWQNDVDPAVDQSALAMFFRPIGMTGGIPGRLSYHTDRLTLDDFAIRTSMTWKYKKKGDATEHTRTVYFGLSQMKTLMEKWKQAQSPAPPKNEEKEKKRLERQQQKAEKKAQRKKDAEEEELNWAKQSIRQEELKKASEKRRSEGLSKKDKDEIRQYRIPEADASKAVTYYRKLPKETDPVTLSAIAMLFRPVSFDDSPRMAYYPVSSLEDVHEDYQDWAYGWAIVWTYINSAAEEQKREVYFGLSEIKGLVDKWKQAGSPEVPEAAEEVQKRADKKVAKEERKEKHKRDDTHWATQQQKQDSLRTKLEPNTLSPARQQEIKDHSISEEDANKALQYYLSLLLNSEPGVPNEVANMLSCPFGVRSYTNGLALKWKELACHGTVNWKYKYPSDTEIRERMVYVDLPDLKEIVRLWQVAGKPSPPP